MEKSWNFIIRFLWLACILLKLQVDSELSTRYTCCRVADRYARASGAELCRGRQHQHHVHGARLPRPDLRVEEERQGDADHREGKSKGHGKEKKIEITMEVGGRVQVSLGIFVFCFGKSSQNSPKPVLIFWSSIPCVFCLYIILLKVVGYYDLSVLSMSVMGFQKKKFEWGGWVG